ncbi:uncharacterized protein M421DRAFT_418978, partial [Didymella exigua CBS 183.55]
MLSRLTTARYSLVLVFVLPCPGTTYLFTTNEQSFQGALQLSLRCLHRMEDAIGCSCAGLRAFEGWSLPLLAERLIAFFCLPNESKPCINII